MMTDQTILPGETESRRSVCIMLVANEDGFGPTMAVFHLTRGLLNTAEQMGIDLTVMLRGGKQATMSQLIDQELGRYRSQIFQDQKPQGVIQLKKDLRGQLDIGATRDYLVKQPGGYISGRQNYANDIAVALTRVDAVVSFGSPEILHAVDQASKRASRRIWRFEVFDHSWSQTLTNIFGSEEYKEDYRRLFGRSFEDDDEATETVAEIAQDEAKADRVWLFPEFLTSSEYYCHWKGIMEGLFRMQ